MSSGTVAGDLDVIPPFILISTYLESEAFRIDVSMHI
jgi:hypothetical protein